VGEGAPAWFRKRPDGTVQFAENPAQEVRGHLPDRLRHAGLERAVAGAARRVAFWAREGVEIFRVDNPHTKPFAFWEWVIAEIRAIPALIFLSEAFTRPRVMHRLAKLGFTQSYTYFTWRSTQGGAHEYFTELARTIRASTSAQLLAEHARHPAVPPAERGPADVPPALLLAATLAANYGIYGPPTSSARTGRATGQSEEYLDSEKYEIKQWDRSAPTASRPHHEGERASATRTPALQSDWSLAFHPTTTRSSWLLQARGDDDLVAVNSTRTRRRRVGTLDLAARARARRLHREGRLRRVVSVARRATS
jgi:starch synthase (maltosyl-transferring)